MGANPSRTQTINSVREKVNHARNTRSSSLALDFFFIGKIQGSGLTPIFVKPLQNLIYWSFKPILRLPIALHNMLDKTGTKSRLMDQ
jgi:hypothetical protein